MSFSRRGDLGRRGEEGEEGGNSPTNGRKGKRESLPFLRKGSAYSVEKRGGEGVN